MVSAPADYPPAHICNECIAVCNYILEDDRLEKPPLQSQSGEDHPMLRHPLAPRFFTAVEQWITREAQGLDVGEDIAGMRSLAERMLRGQ